MEALEAEVEKINADLEDKPILHASHEEQTMRQERTCDQINII